MLRWHVQEGRSAIPKSVRPERIAENFDIFDFELSDAELKAIDVLDTGVRGGPEPKDVNLENFGRPIPEARDVGRRHPTRAQQLVGDFAPKLVSLTDDVLFGDVRGRSELSPRDRSLVTDAGLIAGG
jgi:alkylhydroperoxidase/carboxymuconolactone decarboxylase family protein YurZ